MHSRLCMSLLVCKPTEHLSWLGKEFPISGIQRCSFSFRLYILLFYVISLAYQFADLALILLILNFVTGRMICKHVQAIFFYC